MVVHSVDSLRCFLTAARLLNFRRAARAHALTAAAFGQRIRQLEEQLDKPLFHRTTRRVELTEAGQALVDPAKRCVDAADECVQTAHGRRGPPAMEIVLGTRHELGMSWIMPNYGALTQIQPKLTVHLYVGSGPDLIRRVRSMEIDAAITSTRLSDARLEADRLHEEQYVLVGSPALLKQNPLRNAQDAREHTLLDISPDLPLFRYLRDAPNAPDLQFGKTIALGSIDAIRQRVDERAGVAVLPRYLVEADLKARRFRRLLPKYHPLSDHFRLIYRSSDPRAALFGKLAAFLRSTPLT